MAVFYLNMKYETTIDPSSASQHLGDADWAFVDCRFYLGDTGRGEREYGESHIPGAVYASLDRDLSAPWIPGVTGRHPLPSPEALCDTFSAFGISKRTQVVAYDDANGSMAARLWWLLKWAGHEAASVLDGGFAGWVSAGMPLAAGSEKRPLARFTGTFRPEMIFQADQVLSALDDPEYIVLDSRSAERYKGLNETLDPVAGHIRGAVSAPYMENLRADGSLKPAPELADRFRRLVGKRDAGHTVFYCGSGVTAAHNILAFAHAGLGLPRLYPGSWSEWITDPDRPIAVGG